jgi:hypothetical protein
MRSFTKKALTFGLLGATAIAWSGCSPEKQTQYVAGISTQVKVPRDLKTVRVDVTVAGIPALCNSYKVYDGKVQLPRSLGTFPSDASKLGPITVSVVGFTDEYDDANQTMAACQAPKVGADGVRVLRKSRQPYVSEQTLFLPMALKFGCYDTDCETGANGVDKTCKAGRCYDATTDPSKLVPFTPDLVDGTGGSCFKLEQCMKAAIPPAVVNVDDCTYAIPNTPSEPKLASPDVKNPISTPGDGINVAVTYDGSDVTELLDLDPEEGFSIPDPAKPQQFRLAPGLCDMVKGRGPDPVDPSKERDTPHRITGIRASALCRAKVASQPLCQEDAFKQMGLDASGVSPKASVPNKCKAFELKPSESALVILADDTVGNKDLFEDAESGLLALELGLKDPAFARTQVGISYSPGANACSGASVPGFVNARQDLKKIIATLKTHAVQGDASIQPQLAGGLKQTVALLQSQDFARFNKRAVLVLGNRGFAANACTNLSPVEQANLGRSGGQKVETFALLFTFNPDFAVKDKNDPGQTQTFAEAALVAPTGAYDARGAAGKANALTALQDLTSYLATCTYDVPTDPSAAGFDDKTTLAYTDATAVPAKPSQKIGFDAGCVADDSNVSGWTFVAGSANPRRIRVCGQACKDYQSTLKSSQGYAALYQQASQAVPMFWYNNPCAP